MNALVEKIRAPFRYYGIHDWVAQAIFAAGAVLRIALVMLGDWMDAKYGRTYTDVDYVVFSEGAREVWEGRSPYDRATYRYTPLLAWLTIPNVWWPSFGKHMFTVVDMTIAGLTFALLRWRGLGERSAAIFSAAFLLHPFAINISTRGNADSLVAALVLAMLYFLFAPARGSATNSAGANSSSSAPTLGAPLARRVDAAAVCFGLAVHTKIYPFIFALPLLLALDRNYAPQDFPHHRVQLQQLAATAHAAPAAAAAEAPEGSKRSAAAAVEAAALDDAHAAAVADGGASATSATDSAGSGAGSASTLRRRGRASSSSASARTKKEKGSDKSPARAKKQAIAAEDAADADSAAPVPQAPPIVAPSASSAAPSGSASAAADSQAETELVIDESGSRFSLAMGAPVAGVVRALIEWGVAAPLAAALGFVEDFSSPAPSTPSGSASAGAGASGAAVAVAVAPTVQSLRARYGPRAPLVAAAAAPNGHSGRSSAVSRLIRAALAGVYWAHDFVTPRRVGFGLVALAVFAGVTAACYAVYGWTFLWETYLYHLTRTDNRHNFSPYFYDLYLRFDEPPASRRLAGLLSFLPQFGTLAVLGGLYHRDLPMALLLQTLVFVAWNKVITVQYFHWYLSLAPLVLPQAGLALAALGQRSVRAAAVAAFLCIAWLLTEIFWNAPAYHLEWQGQSVFAQVWGAGVLFFAVNIASILALIRGHRFVPFTKAGQLVRLPAMWWSGLEAKRAE